MRSVPRDRFDWGGGCASRDGGGLRGLRQNRSAEDDLLGLRATVGFALMPEFVTLAGDAFEAEEGIDEAAVFTIRAILSSQNEGGLTNEMGKGRNQVLEINGLLIEKLDEL